MTENDGSNPNEKIFGKKNSKERIKRFEERLFQLKMENNMPVPNYEMKGKIVDRMKDHNVPSATIAMVSDFEIEWIKSYGKADMRTGVKAGINTLFEAGSTTKTITAAAALMAVEEKLVELDENINNVLKTWKVPENELTREKKVTLRQLLSHNAGINRPDSMFGFEENSVPTLEEVLNGESPAMNDPAEVEYTPGTNHQYSNLGYIIIQKMLEDVYNKEFSEIIQEKIFDPLEMKNSMFKEPIEKQREKRAAHHNVEGEGLETSFHPTALGQGGLITTPFDLAKFMVEIMKGYNNESTILSANLVNKMLTPILALDPTKFFGMTGQGLGMFLIEKEGKKYFVHPGGNAPAMACMFVGEIEKGQGVIVMSNGAKGELLNLEINFGIAHEYDWPLWQ